MIGWIRRVFRLRGAEGQPHGAPGPLERTQAHHDRLLKRADEVLETGILRDFRNMDAAIVIQKRRRA